MLQFVQMVLWLKYSIKVLQFAVGVIVVLCPNIFLSISRGLGVFFIYLAYLMSK
jgi:hypothetical protein